MSAVILGTIPVPEIEEFAEPSVLYDLSVNQGMEGYKIDGFLLEFDAENFSYFQGDVPQETVEFGHPGLDQIVHRFFTVHGHDIPRMTVTL